METKKGKIVEKYRKKNVDKGQKWDKNPGNHSEPKKKFLNKFHKKYKIRENKIQNNYLPENSRKRKNPGIIPGKFHTSGKTSQNKITNYNRNSLKKNTEKTVPLFCLHFFQVFFSVKFSSEIFFHFSIFFVPHFYLCPFLLSNFLNKLSTYFYFCFFLNPLLLLSLFSFIFIFSNFFHFFRPHFYFCHFF